MFLDDEFESVDVKLISQVLQLKGDDGNLAADVHREDYGDAADCAGYRKLGKRAQYVHGEYHVEHRSNLRRKNLN